MTTLNQRDARIAKLKVAASPLQCQEPDYYLQPPALIPQTATDPSVAKETPRPFSAPIPATDLLSVAQTASYLKISRSLVYALHAQGAFPKHKLRGRTFFRVSELDAYLQRLTVVHARPWDHV